LLIYDAMYRIHQQLSNPLFHMLNRVFLLVVVAAVQLGSLGAQDVVITGFENGHLSFSNSLPAGLRSVYTLEWRPNLGTNSS
jgi:hypothetical protein